MFFPAQNRTKALNGLFFVVLFATMATTVAEFSPMKKMGISPLITGIIMGMIYGNTLRRELPSQWVPGIVFSTKSLLKLGVVLYGFRLTFQDIFAVGIEGLTVSVTVVITTFLLGSFLGIRIFKLDPQTAMLTSAGSAVCGAAAVLAMEPVLKSEPYKSAVAVSTVVIFGTLSMFLYPMLYKSGFYGVDHEVFGIYIGGTIHEVAHAVAAGNAVSPEAATNAIIVKMIRVMMLAPLLIGLSIFLEKRKKGSETGEKRKISIPWFAVLFIVVVGINSANIIPKPVVEFWNALDLFILTMAMSALGIETNFNKIKGVGMRPIYLAGVLFFWVTVGGYLLTKTVTGIM